MSAVRITDLVAARTSAPPGSLLAVDVHLRLTEAARVTVAVDLLDVATPVATRLVTLALAAGPHVRRFRLRLPTAERRGYGLRATVTWPGGRSAREAAVEAIAGWWESPRHVALTTFRRAADAPRQVAAARRWNVTVAQAYDWMYRHYRYAAPEEPFVDALGRRVSHAAVRELVRAGHRAGIATLAYGAVYGAEAEHVARHPDERVFDEAGEPLSLGGVFFINDLRPASPWRRRLLREYASACRRLGFDGIHMDTYGPPHEARAADGERIRFADVYPGLIAEAAARVAAGGGHRRVIFNCVEGFPLEAVARAPVAALYLELWPPDDRYADLVAWIERAQAAGGGRAVVIAAYVPALRDAGRDPIHRAAAGETAVLLSTVITAAGASHHGLADGDRVLVDGYYPDAVRPDPRTLRELRAAWVFGARYLHLLSDPAARLAPLDGVDLRDEAGRPVPLAAAPRAGAAWARVTETPVGRVLSIVDLRTQLDDRWTAERQRPVTARGWSLRWEGAAAPVAMSPWSRGGASAALPSRGGAWRLPPFRRWLIVHDPAPPVGGRLRPGGAATPSA
ncbi:MAG: hypothetical protein M0T75_09235 [Chloroflexi bacterium]|nr:hypothetical protein [Chloroflexota bacterium]